jgi:hypothetical protein
MTKIESSLRNVVLKYKQDDILDKDEMMDVQECNNCRVAGLKSQLPGVI